MATADLSPDGTRIHVSTAYTDKDRMVQVPGASWHQPVWHVPLTWPACLQLRAVFGGDLTLGEGLVTWAWAERRDHVDPMLALREALSLPADHPVCQALDGIEAGEQYERGHVLRPIQRAAVAYLVTAAQAGFWEGMGSGKTPVTIRALQVMHELGLDPWPLVVVCPNSLKHTVWLDHLEGWAPEVEATVVEGPAGVRRKLLQPRPDVGGAGQAWVLNWEVARLHSRLAPYGNTRLTDAQRQPKELNHLGPRTVILDEAHRLRTVGSRVERDEDGNQTRVPTSQQALAAWALLHQARYRFELTGTPADRDVGDVWGLLHGIRPDWFPGKTRHLERYAETTFGLWGGQEVIGLRADTTAEYHAVTTPLYRRIPQEISMPELPPVLPTMIRETPLTPKQRRAYDQMERTMLAELNELLVAPDPLVQLTRLTQFASASAEVDEAGRVRLTAPSAKVDDLVELLAELGDEPLVVAAESRQLIELAAERLRRERVSHGLVTGAVAPVDRATSVRRFQDGGIRVILLTLAAGSEGLTLTRASRMLFMQVSYSPMVNHQAEGRIRRFGSEIHDSIQYIQQLAPGTVEERREAVIAGKEGRVEELWRDREVLLRLLGGDT